MVKLDGNCFGLDDTCEPVETDHTNWSCDCPSMPCAWAAWSMWSASCGKQISRQRKLSSMTAPPDNCHPFTEECDITEPEEFQRNDVECVCMGEECDIGQWSSWTSDCGDRARTRTVGMTSHHLLSYSCDNHSNLKAQMECLSAPSKQEEYLPCNCSYTVCRPGEWTMWSATCGLRTSTRSRVLETITSSDINCKSLEQPCIDGMEKTEITECICASEFCAWGEWSDWSASCGRNLKRHRVIIYNVFNDPACPPIDPICSLSQEQSAETADILCNCTDLHCIVSEWGPWSNACGPSSRNRTVNLTPSIQKAYDCLLHDSSPGVNICLNSPSMEATNSYCPCEVTTCSWGQWTEPTATCGNIISHRSALKVLEVRNDGRCKSLQDCPIDETRIRVKPCDCMPRACEWGEWTQWSATCGSGLTRQRRLIHRDPVADIPLCDTYDHCNLVSEIMIDQADILCNCTSLSLEVHEWSLWSTSCGCASRERSVRITDKVSPSYSCDTEENAIAILDYSKTTVSESRDIPCPVKIKLCSWNAWGAWSSSCGNMTRARIATVDHVESYNPTDCDAAESSDDHCKTREVEEKFYDCGCPSNTCSYSEWTSWNGTCGVMTRSRSFLGFNISTDPRCSSLVVQSCDQPLFEVETSNCECLKFICSVGEWTQWSSSVGTATRERTISSSHSVYKAPVCDDARNEVLATNCSEVNILEGRNIPRPCTFEICHWSAWSEWTSQCGPRTQERISRTALHTSLLGDCAELDEHCEPRDTRSEVLECGCSTKVCNWGQWSEWSASCGRGIKRQRSIIYVDNIPRGDCPYVDGACDLVEKEQDGVETKDVLCNCSAAQCNVSVWSDWNSGCGRLNRTRQVSRTVTTLQAYDCAAEVPNIDIDRLQEAVGGSHSVSLSGASRSFLVFPNICFSLIMIQVKLKPCPCYYNTCYSESWSEWSSTCGERHRERKVLPSMVYQLNGYCQGLNRFCPPLESQTDRVPCRCTAKSCNWGEWSEWSPNCGLDMTRTRSWVIEDTQYDSLDCEKKEESSCALPSRPPEVETNSQMCSCSLFTCELSQWSPWMPSCGMVLRNRDATLKTEHFMNYSCNNEKNNVEVKMCEGSMVAEGLYVPCPCEYTKCEWSNWEDWAAGCGEVERNRTAVSTIVTKNDGDCENLVEDCSTQVQRKLVSCECPMEPCEWTEWSAPADDACGMRVELRREIVYNNATKSAEDCPAVAKPCTLSSEDTIKVEDVQCECSNYTCHIGEWSEWGTTCGPATHSRSVRLEMTPYLAFMCDPDEGMESKSTCHAAKSSESRQLVCPCTYQVCKWSEWSDWSRSCGQRERVRWSNTTLVSKEDGDCDGLSEICPSESWQQDQTLCDCLVEVCDYTEWSQWSSSCGQDMIRRRSKQSRFMDEKHLVCMEPITCDQLTDELIQTSSSHCQCSSVMCVMGDWTKWNQAGDMLSRTRQASPITKVFDSFVCPGEEENEAQRHKCASVSTVERTRPPKTCSYTVWLWGQWGEWSATCGENFRTRHSVATVVTLSHSICPHDDRSVSMPPPQRQERKKDCGCSKTACEWSEWSPWMPGECGENLHRNSTKLQVAAKPDCPPVGSCRKKGETETDSKSIRCECLQGTCTLSEWSSWSRSCGDMVRERSAMSRLSLVSLYKCPDVEDQLSQCQSAHLVEEKFLECPCFKPACIHQDWSSWSQPCGRGIIRSRTARLEVNSRGLPLCEDSAVDCPDVQTEQKDWECDCMMEVCEENQDWSPWSGSCGRNLTRTRGITRTLNIVKSLDCETLSSNCIGGGMVERTEIGNFPCSCLTYQCKLGKVMVSSAECGSTIIRQSSDLITYHNLDYECPDVDFATEKAACDDAAVDITTPSVCPCTEKVCMYSEWTSWQTGCGRLSRQRMPVVVEVNRMDGRCGHDPVQCSTPLMEIEHVPCACKVWDCTWGEWSPQSKICGRGIQKIRYRNFEQRTVNATNCNSLKTSCDLSPTEVHTEDVLCSCEVRACVASPWTAWSSSCGFASRTRRVDEHKSVVAAYDCQSDGQSDKEPSCHCPPSVETRAEPCDCQSVDCVPTAWSAWSADCRNSSRSRSYRAVPVHRRSIACDALPKSCSNMKPETETRNNTCTCEYVHCSWSDWGDWEPPCTAPVRGARSRRRRYVPTPLRVLANDCSAFPHSCKGDAQTDTSTSACVIRPGDQP